MKKLAILSSLFLLAMNSCSNEEIFNEEIHPNYEKRITVVAEDLTPAEGTRTSYTDNGNGYSFAWSEGDALGIFPTSGHQTDFPIGADGIGSNTAVFDGGKWALRPNESYAAYYPLIHDFDLVPTAIPIDYTGQIQNGNGNTDHLSKYDYMASTFTEVDAKGNVNFNLQHLGCLVQFKLTMPEADSYYSLEIVSSGTPFITSGTYSLSDTDHTLTNIQTSERVTIDLNNVSTIAENKILNITAMFAPVDLSGSILTLNLKGTNSIYKYVVNGRDLSQGRVSSIDNIPYITFHADAEQTLTMGYNQMNEIETIEYSVNNGAWLPLSTQTVIFGSSNGDLRLRGRSPIGTAKSNDEYATISFGNTNVAVSCLGDIRTLVDYKKYATCNTENARFCSLFRNCSSLTTAPELPATTLADYCYRDLFVGCTSLTSAPELPATVLADYCYNGMFSGTSLEHAPTLPAEEMKEGCYMYMFSYCRSLYYPPELKATKLADYCYLGMFSNCTSLTNAPELPATVLANSCYYNMFYFCTHLRSAPDLLAPVLVRGCYNRMFAYCEYLGYVKMMATEGDVDGLYGWLEGTNEYGGIFIYNSAAPWSSYTLGVPFGWIIQTESSSL